MMAMVDETSDAVCIISLDGLVQHVNAPFLRMFGYRKVGWGRGCRPAAARAGKCWCRRGQGGGATPPCPPASTSRRASWRAPT